MSFWQGFEKRASVLKNILKHETPELLGLGILAAPSIAGLAGKKMSSKAKDSLETVGLGTLAAPSALKVLKAIRHR